jgi:hypothetical protein
MEQRLPASDEVIGHIVAMHLLRVASNEVAVELLIVVLAYIIHARMQCMPPLLYVCRPLIIRAACAQ